MGDSAGVKRLVCCLFKEYIHTNSLREFTRFLVTYKEKTSLTCVPTGMKTGVSTSAWGSRMTAARALVVPHSATIFSDRAVAAGDDEAGAGLMLFYLC